MEDDTMDGCVVSKVPIDNDEIEVVDEVPSSSQPATQPLGGNRDTTDSEEEEGSSTEEEEIVIYWFIFSSFTLFPSFFSMYSFLVGCALPDEILSAHRWIDVRYENDYNWSSY